MKKIYLFFVICATFSSISCHDFLTKYPNDVTYASSAQDFNELLVGDGYMDVVNGSDLGSWFQVMDDDAVFYIKDNGTRSDICKFHWWEPSPDSESTWDKLYSRIGIMNVILDGIDDYSDEKGVYEKVKGEALFLRASYYWFLVNLYAKPYSTSASSDMGVPLKLDAKIEDRKVSRNSVQECYDLIVSDLRQSISLLSLVTQTVKYRASETAARNLLGRVYLYMNEWALCNAQCDTILSNRSYSLKDFNSLASTESALSASYPETIFTNGGNNYYSSSLKMLYSPAMSSFFGCDSTLFDMYESNDLRQGLFYSSFRRVWPLPQLSYTGIPDKCKTSDCSDFFMMRLAEVYLNKSEALVMLGRDAEAVSTVHNLRLKRFVAGSIDSEVISETGEDLLNFIRKERRMELAFEGHRWFDIRRYSVSSKWPMQLTIHHKNYTDSSADGEYVLNEYSVDEAYYLLPIPETEIVLNDGALVQNPIRIQKNIVR